MNCGMNRHIIRSTLFVAVVTAAFHGTTIAQKNITILGELPPPLPLPEVVESRATDAEGRPVESRYASITGISRFIAKANEFASGGYRLQFISHKPRVAVTGNSLPPHNFDRIQLSAIFRYTPGEKFEYDWMEAYRPGDIVSRIAASADTGFRFVKSVPFFDDSKCRDGIAGHEDQLGGILAMLASYWCVAIGDVLIMERASNVPEEYEYQVLTGSWGWGKRPTKELDEELSRCAEIGFVPIMMGEARVPFKSETYILVERPKNGDPLLDPPQYKYLKAEFGFFQKLNRAASDGYRIRLLGMIGAFRHVLLVKDVNTQVETSTRSVAGSKMARHSVAKVVGRPSEYLTENRAARELLFVDRNVQGFEYRLLRMSPDHPKPSKKNLSPSPLRSQDEILYEFDALIKTGYSIRDLVYIDGPAVLFERSAR
jgi:hypothetical protein